MKLKIAWIGKTREPAIRSLTADFAQRISHYVETEQLELASEGALLKQIEKLQGRTKPVLVLLDSRGRELSSEQFAEFIRNHQERGTQNLFFVIGPADGFSDEARRHASQLLSLGKITMPHELARVVLFEQIYRAFTILAKHPYHSGH